MKSPLDDAGEEFPQGGGDDTEEVPKDMDGKEGFDTDSVA